MKSPTEPSLLLRVPEAAAHLRVTRATVYRWLAAGELTCVYVGPNRHVRIPRAAIEAIALKGADSRAS